MDQDPVLPKLLLDNKQVNCTCQNMLWFMNLEITHKSRGDEPQPCNLTLGHSLPLHGVKKGQLGTFRFNHQNFERGT